MLWFMRFFYFNVSDKVSREHQWGISCQLCIVAFAYFVPNHTVQLNLTLTNLFFSCAYAWLEESIELKNYLVDISFSKRFSSSKQVKNIIWPMCTTYSCLHCVL